MQDRHPDVVQDRHGLVHGVHPPVVLRNVLVAQSVQLAELLQAKQLAGQAVQLVNGDTR